MEGKSFIADCNRCGAPGQTDLDLPEIVKDDIFTFIVGHENQRYNVHVSELKSISVPLGVMMTNGQMDESIKKEAVLSDVDPDVFGMLVKYAYKGLCGISDAYPGPALTVSLPTNFVCHKCGNLVSKDYENGQQYPFCSGWCRSSYLDHFRNSTLSTINRKRRSHVYTLYCVADGSGISLGWNSGHDLLCSPCTELGQGKYYPPYQDTLDQIDVVVSKCSPEFSAKRYGCTNTSHEELQEHIRRHLPQDCVTNTGNNPLLLHAKLYVLASKYMVPDLPQICLHKLYALLKVFRINDESIDELIELILYVYENTSDDGDILEGTGDQMRDLIIRYTVDRAKDLMRYENFRSRAMLGAGGVPSADLMAVTYGETHS